MARGYILYIEYSRRLWYSSWLIKNSSGAQIPPISSVLYCPIHRTRKLGRKWQTSEFDVLLNFTLIIFSWKVFRFFFNFVEFRQTIHEVYDNFSQQNQSTTLNLSTYLLNGLIGSINFIYVHCFTWLSLFLIHILVYTWNYFYVEKPSCRRSDRECVLFFFHHLSLSTCRANDFYNALSVQGSSRRYTKIFFLVCPILAIAILARLFSICFVTTTAFTDYFLFSHYKELQRNRG